MFIIKIIKQSAMGIKVNDIYRKGLLIKKVARF